MDVDTSGSPIGLGNCNSVTRITGDLLIQNVGHLASLSDLGNLMDISGALVVENTWALTTLQLPKLELIEGSALFFHNKDLTTVAFPKLKEIGGALIVQGNTRLTSLGMGALEKIFAADTWVQT